MLTHSPWANKKMVVVCTFLSSELNTISETLFKKLVFSDVT
jgi:hypothetical protein